jgi:hypothetical protein
MNSQSITALLLDSNVEILALLADESHEYLRNKDSARCQAVFPVFAKAQMIVHISGTLFPLGPKTDAEHTMFMLGGEYKKSPVQSKWAAAKLDKQLNNLFKESHGRKVNWDIRAFKTLITPFYLRRTLRSKYRVSPDAPRLTYIIPRKYCRPEIQIIKPGPCRHEAEALSSMSTMKSIHKGYININQLKTRSTDAMLMTWFGCDLYKRYKRVRELDGGHTPAAESVIANHLQDDDPPARLSILCGVLRTIKEQGERFVLVSENVSLISLATYVTSLDEIDG